MQQRFDDWVAARQQANQYPRGTPTAEYEPAHIREHEAYQRLMAVFVEIPWQEFSYWMVKIADVHSKPVVPPTKEETCS